MQEELILSVAKADEIDYTKRVYEMEG